MTKKLLLSSIIGVVVLVGIIALGMFLLQPGTAPLEQGPGAALRAQAGPGLPVRLTIASIHVDAPIIYLGLEADGSVGAPDGPDEVAWYKLGPRPGQQGSSVLTGHFGTWKDGSGSVFDTINKLKAGDKVQVTDDQGKQLTFEVIESRTYGRGDSPTEVFNKTDGAYLNLITCQGEWLAGQKTYSDRLVVFTKLVP